MITCRTRMSAGTAAELAAANFKPLNHELVIATDTGKWKIGNGVDHYVDLPYTGPDIITSIDDALAAQHLVDNATYAPLNEIAVESFRASNVTDDATLTAAFAAITSGSTLRFQAGRTYAPSTGLDISLSGLNDVVIDFNGSTIVLPSVNDAGFWLTGGYTASKTTVTADIAARSRTITVVDSSGITAGSIITIYSSGEVFNPERPAQYLKAEIARVESVAGTTLTLSQPTYDSYTTTGNMVTVGLINPVTNLKLLRPNIVGAGTGYQQTGLRIQYFDGLMVEKPIISSAERTGLLGAIGLDFKVLVGNVSLCNETGLGYGVKAAGVQGVTFYAITGRRNRHTVDADNGPNAIPCRDVMYFRVSANDDTSAGISTHGACDGAHILACVTRYCGGGIIVRSSKTAVEGCRVLGSKTTTESSESYVHGIRVGDDAPWVTGVGIAGDGLKIINNRIDITNARWSTDAVSACGIYATSSLTHASIEGNSFAGFSGNGIYARGNTGSDVQIERNSIDCTSQVGTSGSTFLHGVYVEPASLATGNTQNRLAVRLNDITGALYSAVRIQGGTSGSDVSDEITIERNLIRSAGLRTVDIGQGYFGENIRVERNICPDNTSAVTLGASSLYARSPVVALNDIAQAGVIPIQRGQENGSFLRGSLWYGAQGVSATAALTAGNLMLAPFFVGRRVTLAAIGLSVTVAGVASTVIRLGIYKDVSDGVGGYPGDLLLDAGTIAGDAVAFAQIASSQVLDPGLYWIGAVAQGGSPTVQVLNGPNQVVGYQSSGAISTRGGYRQTSVTGALPATFSTTVDAQGGAPHVQLKIA